MNPPGFTADATLRKASRAHRTTAGETAAEPRVVPQLFGWRFGCIPTAEGGMWCCIYGGKQPICWEFPPPVVIAT